MEHCKFLLGSGAKVECQDRFGRNALQFAVERLVEPPQRYVFVLFLDHGLDVLAKYDDGQTLWDLALDCRHLSISLINTIEKRVKSAFRKYDGATHQSMGTVRRDTRKVEIK